EVLWTRLFAQVLHHSVYPFAAVSLVFLVALASGAALGAVTLRRVSGASVATASLIAAALATSGGVWVFVRATDGLAYVGMRTGLLEYVIRIVGIAAATAGPAALASGAVLAAGGTLRAEAEGAGGIVTVVDTGEDLQLRLDNYYVLGGSAAARNERRQGLVPLLLHPRPRRAAFIGMATGITASAASALGVD